MVLTRLDTASELKQLCTGRECEAQSQTATERLQKGSRKNVGTQFGSLIEIEILKLFQKRNPNHSVKVYKKQLLELPIWKG
jgi:hypothetical protein